jgi:hypothetical protein
LAFSILRLLATTEDANQQKRDEKDYGFHRLQSDNLYLYGLISTGPRRSVPYGLHFETDRPGS